MATILTDDFNSYNDGNLDGQGSWTYYLNHAQVQGTTVKEGAKGIANSSGGDDAVTKAGTALTDGKITFYAMMKDHASWSGSRRMEFRCIQGTSWGSVPYTLVAFHQDGYIKLLSWGSWKTIQAYNDDQWYCVEMEWRSTPDYKYRVRIDGGTWTDWWASGNGGTWTTGLNRVGFDLYCNLYPKQFIDHIAEEPIGGEVKTGAATLSGAGTLAAAARLLRSAKATLSGTGALAVAARATRIAKATLSGTGSLSAIAATAGTKLIGQDDHTIYASLGANYHWSDKFTAVATGVMDKFYIKCSGSGNVKLAVYADSAGSPGDLLNAVNTGQAVVAGWNEIAFPATQITQGTVYWLSFIADSAVVGYWEQAGNTRKYKSVSYAGFTFPDPAGSFDGSFYDLPALTAGWQIAVYGAGTLSGTGALAVLGRATRIGKATLSGTGGLAAAARTIRTAKATLSGAGSLAAAGLITRRGAATMSGTGTLAAAGKATRPGAATLSGTGTLAAAARRTRAGSATMAGTGSLAAAAHITRAATATLSGEGSLTAAGTVITAALTGSATLSGTGSLSASGHVTTVAQATLSGTGSLSAAAHPIRSAAATLAGEGTLAAAARLTAIGKATLSGTGSLTAAARLVLSAAATLSGEGTLAAKAVYIVIARGTLSGTGTLVVAATAYTGVSPTLLAAQLKAIRNPYVEAKVYDYEQGIKRLSWTRLYTGSETDNHHGIAIDGEGSMHRIRSGGSSTLLYQKITSPGPSSDYSQWTEIAADCSGPCAIAAYGAKIYIFYRKTDDTLRKYYSSDYGQNWTNAELAAYAGVLSMAAAWWSTGNTVVCFALKASQVNAITLNSITQETQQHTWSDANHPLLTTYGIGATYDAALDEMPVVIAGKEDDSPYDHHDLFRTRLNDLYNFLALESFLMAPDGEDITYEYPDCHLPSSPAEYETIRVTAVDKFAGTTAYSRPVTCHMVKGTTWSDTTFTEPRPLMDIAPAYGLRTASTADYWWISMPAGVWRAARPAADPLDLTTRIASLSLNQSLSNLQSPLVITLDNSDAYFATPGEGALASLRFRSEIALRLGYKTTAGNEALAAGTYWIDSWEYSHAPNQSTFTITALDGLGLIARWSARYQMRWNKDDVDPRSVWQIMYQLLARVGIRLTNTPAKPQSSAINNLYPDLALDPGTSGDAALRRLLSFVPDGLVMRGQEAFTKNPLSSEASCYAYGAAHKVIRGQYSHQVTLSRSRALGQEEDADRIVEDALDWDLLSLAVDQLAQVYDPNLQNATRTQERADAILRKNALSSKGGQITVPTNVTQQLFDVVQVTDARCGISEQKYRVLAIATAYDRRQSRYHQTLALAAP